MMVVKHEWDEGLGRWSMVMEHERGKGLGR